MRSSLRTRGPAIVLALAAGGLSACGYLSIDFLPAGGEEAPDGAADGSDEASTDGNTVADGGSDVEVDAGRCTGPNCPGVIYVSTIGNDQDPGTAELPMRSISAALSKADPKNRNQLYVAGGAYHENVNLVEGVAIVGGFSCSAKPCSWAYDLKANVTKINDQRAEGVIADHSITRATLLDSVTINGAAGAALGTTPSIALSLDSASPIISKCTILGAINVYDSYAVYITASVTPSDPSGPLLIGNPLIQAGTATQFSAGIRAKGGGSGTPLVKAVIALSDVRGGAGLLSYGIRADGNSDVTMSDNRILGGAASAEAMQSECESWGVQITEGGKATIERNRINFDAITTTATTASCNQTNVCGGVRVGGSDARIESNAIRGAKAPSSAAVMLAKTASGTPDIRVNGNTLEGEGTSGTTSAAIVITKLDGDGSVTFGRARNNIMTPGNAANHYGVLEATLNNSGHQAHFEVLDNNLFLTSAGVMSAAAYAYWDGSMAFYIGSTQINTAQQLSSFSHNNVVGTPVFAMFPHLMATSPGIDQGTNSEAPKLDIDNESRPKGNGMDIGADEVK